MCSYLHCDDPIFDPVVGALPRLFNVRPPDGPTADWVVSSVQDALDASAKRQSASGGVTARLAELVFVEILYLYLESSPTPRNGLLAVHS